MKKVFFSTAFLLAIILFVSSCKTVQVKENTPVSDITQNANIVQVPEITPENVILTSEIKPEKPQIISTIQTVKQMPKTAMETLKAAPAKVIEVSNKIAERVKVETKNSIDYWPILLSIFVVIVVGYFVYDSKDQKSVKRRKKKAKIPEKPKKL